MFFPPSVIWMAGFRFLDGEAKGENDHHQCEAVFKAFAKALKDAIKIEHDQIPSTKGII